MSGTSLCALLEQYNLGTQFTFFTVHKRTNADAEGAAVGAHLSADFAGSTGLADVLQLDLSTTELPQVPTFFFLSFFL
jgi:hypothetical protein